ncbi:F-type H+-transporting ATPase subunit b [Geomicrobium halophilum]|uniref:ATP synthase subunit b n=1 Tax=Geomicrobium halophilum TaxID=549000 RepID=A0A841PZW9_9BACL|nr:F0F1 ATP synthase subunit B [Geomicrobium halophilum]MBB6450462.1 F-type H+-transporting ATPase subunit b [Geomicrobium halophilum]
MDFLEFIADINWGSALYQLLIFSLLIWVVSRFALKPLLGVMQKREQQVNDNLDNAEKSRAEAEQYLEQQREELKNAREQAQEMIDNANKISEQQSREILDNARSEASRLKDAAVADINREKEQALESVRDQVASLSVAIATKVIEKELDESEQEKLIDSYLKEVENK